MKIIDTLRDWYAYRASLEVTALGFVPTMGALHAGHLSLVRQCQADNEATVVSIYVNPTQFDQTADLAAYPRSTDQDIALLRQHKVDAVFLPDYDALYPRGYVYRVSETKLSREMCGGTRPGHFDGVLTVVLKLLNIVRPDSAYFGEKDYQQLQLVRGMVDDFFLPVAIRSCPIVREHDGLAMSSRNQRLDPDQRSKAPLLFRTLDQGGSPEQVRQALERAGFSVDYVTDFLGHRLAAVHLGAIRLIDNVPLG